MTSVVVAPNPIPSEGRKLFLAGAIDMGNAVNWQSQIIEELKDLSQTVIINPRRDDFTVDETDEQILWELNGLEIADLIFMWFPSNSEAPISLLETGLYMRSGKLVIGVEEGYFRKKNLELTCKFYNVNMFNNLNELVSVTRSLLRKL
jgi:hypothetical protein